MDLRVEDVDPWADRSTLSGDVYLVVDGDPVRTDAFPGSTGFELPGTVVGFEEHVQRLLSEGVHRGWPLTCGGCGEPGCTRIRWRARLRPDHVDLQVEVGGDAVFDGHRRVDRRAYFRALAGLVDRLVEELRRHDLDPAEVAALDRTGRASTAALRALERSIREQRLPSTR